MSHQSSWVPGCACGPSVVGQAKWIINASLINDLLPMPSMAMTNATMETTTTTNVVAMMNDQPA